MDTRVVSIGALSANPMWNEREPVRTGHATTTLIRSEDAVIVVDPGLPAQALIARLHERSGVTPDQVTHVFLTSFTPEARRGIGAFPQAQWLISESERESVGVPLAQSLARVAQSIQGAKDAQEEPHEDEIAMARVLERDVTLLQRMKPAPDSLAQGVDLFPLPGVSMGMCGLLVSEDDSTTLVCGDAVASAEHIEKSRIVQGAQDVDRAMVSFREALEIADFLVPGRDNIMRVRPGSGSFGDL